MPSDASRGVSDGTPALVTNHTFCDSSVNTRKSEHTGNHQFKSNKTQHANYPSEFENNVEVTMAHFHAIWAVNNQKP
jgi:hypothetical protein